MFVSMIEFIEKYYIHLDVSQAAYLTACTRLKIAIELEDEESEEKWGCLLREEKEKEKREREGERGSKGARWNIAVTYCEKDGTSHTKVRDACSTQDNLNGSRFEHRKIKVTSFLKANANRFISYFIHMTRHASWWRWMMPLRVNCMMIHMIIVSVNSSCCTSWSNWRLSLHT